MTYSQLKYFLEVAHLGNFTYAADKLYVTTPSLSKCIGSLEDELGFKLFDRKNRGVELTEKGKIFYNAIETPFYQLEMAFNQTIIKVNNNKQIINIAFNESEIIHPSITKLISQFNEQYKDTHQFVIHLGEIDKVYSGLTNQKYDIAIITENQLKNKASVSYYKLNISTLSFVLPANHPMANKECLSFKELMDETYIIIKPEENSDYVEPLLKLLSRAKDSMFVFSLQEALYNVAIGNGIAIIPTNSINIDNPYIKRIPIPARINENHFCVAWLTDNKNPVVKELCQAIYNGYLYFESKIKPMENDYLYFESKIQPTELI